MPNETTMNVVKAFADDIIPQLKNDMIPYGFLYELYKRWSKQERHEDSSIGRNSFVRALDELVQTGYITGWTAATKDPVRMENALSEPEPVTVKYKYNPEKFQASLYFNGLVRNKVQNPSATDGTNDHSHFEPFTLDMIYQCQPQLEDFVRAAKIYGQDTEKDHGTIYADMKKAVYTQIGKNAADPRLRSSEAWDCFFNEIKKLLKLDA